MVVAPALIHRANRTTITLVHVSHTVLLGMRGTAQALIRREGGLRTGCNDIEKCAEAPYRKVGVERLNAKRLLWEVRCRSLASVLWFL